MEANVRAWLPILPCTRRPKGMQQLRLSVRKSVNGAVVDSEYNDVNMYIIYVEDGKLLLINSRQSLICH